MVAVGSDTGTVAIVNDLTEKVFEVLQISTQPILSLGINDTQLLSCDGAGQCTYFELTQPTNKLKKLCDFQTSPSIVSRLLTEQLALMCDSEGGITRVKLKRWMMIYRA